jgi:hypothetical protein
MASRDPKKRGEASFNIKDLPGIIRILVICIEMYRWVRGRWIRHALEGKKKVKIPRKPAVLRPKSESIHGPGQRTAG